MSTDASTGATRSRTYTDAAGLARSSAVKFDDHAATAAASAREMQGRKGMEEAQAGFEAEARKATATADDRRHLARGFDTLAELEGQD